MGVGGGGGGEGGVVMRRGGGGESKRWLEMGKKQKTSGD